MTVLLANAATTNANFPSNAGVNCNIRRAVYDIYGTFGGATVKLQRSVDGGTTWIDVADSSMTSAGSKEVAIGEGVFVRANIASGSGATLTVALSPV